MKYCIICETQLIGRQRKFCSTKCKNRSTNYKHQNYKTQQTRGRSRKLELIKMKGNKCEVCGYSKNYAALCFHHKNPKKKEFQLDLRHCSNTSWKELINEASKCRLLCSNCHSETHNPECSL